MKPTWLVTNRWLHWDKFEWQFDQIIGASHGQIERVTTDYAVTHLEDLPEVAFIMDKDVAAVAQLEAFGVRCVNSSQSIALCDNKAYTHAALTRAGIAHPKTITAPLVYRNLAAEEWANSEFLAAVEYALGRIYMVGDTPVAAMRRFGQGGDFRANITGGGRAEAWDPPAEYVDVARAAMAALGLDIGSVDFLDAQDPLVGEVNSNAQFASLTETTGIDVAAAVVEYLEQL